MPKLANVQEIYNACNGFSKGYRRQRKGLRPDDGDQEVDGGYEQV